MPNKVVRFRHHQQPLTMYSKVVIELKDLCSRIEESDLQNNYRWVPFSIEIVQQLTNLCCPDCIICHPPA